MVLLWEKKLIATAFVETSTTLIVPLYVPRATRGRAGVRTLPSPRNRIIQPNHLVKNHNNITIAIIKFEHEN